MELKWSDGKPYEKSKRQHQDNFNKQLETQAYTSSLNYDENTWEILNQSVTNNEFKVSNKREELDFKIADRHLIQQIGFNPFLGKTTYADDISIRDTYLKPMNTTQDRIKPSTETSNTHAM